MTTALPQALVSAVNWAETGQKIARAGGDPTVTLQRLATLGVTVVPFTSSDALAVANLWHTTSPIGLSLGDRACLTLAHQHSLPAWTTDQSWSDVDVDVTVRFLR